MDDASTLNPEKLPWEAIQSDAMEAVTLCLTKKCPTTLFIPNAFDVDFALADVDGAPPVLPEGSSQDELFAWIGSLPPHNPLT